MSEAGSATSKRTNKSRKHACAYCGKVEYGDFARHSNNQHPGKEKKKWIPGEALLDEPHCENWKEIIEDETGNTKPNGANPRYARGAGRHYSYKGSMAGSFRAQSERAGSVVGDV